ncbi:hypothetical protein HOLleu_05910 [Holothuria leucospilota]|uniref:Late endosomal/lysosomal adaptor and MAPK and MTOR activator 5 n=1 Tax=Holothuria leucospilota TaxID=206669 RepID=A0A9Q1CMB1_HOLLE|nr:hypothetical protein HOLleu_05910 [Holothuria leucospilota]
MEANLNTEIEETMNQQGVVGVICTDSQGLCLAGTVCMPTLKAQHLLTLLVSSLHWHNKHHNFLLSKVQVLLFAWNLTKEMCWSKPITTSTLQFTNCQFTNQKQSGSLAQFAILETTGNSVKHKRRERAKGDLQQRMFASGISGLSQWSII